MRSLNLFIFIFIGCTSVQSKKEKHIVSVVRIESNHVNLDSSSFSRFLDSFFFIPKFNENTVNLPLLIIKHSPNMGKVKSTEDIYLTDTLVFHTIDSITIKYDFNSSLDTSTFKLIKVYNKNNSNPYLAIFGPPNSGNVYQFCFFKHENSFKLKYIEIFDN